LYEIFLFRRAHCRYQVTLSERRAVTPATKGVGGGSSDGPELFGIGFVHPIP
jgi:hypothetical protein